MPAGGIRNGAGRKKKVVVPVGEEASVFNAETIREYPGLEGVTAEQLSVVQNYIWGGGEKGLFEMAMGESVTMFGGAEIHPPRKNVGERLPACGTILTEILDLKRCSRALSCAGLYREGAKLHFQKNPIGSAELANRFESQRARGLLPDGAPDDFALIFEDNATISQLVKIVTGGVGGMRDINYDIGKADRVLGLLDGRLLPNNNIGLGPMNRAFRAFVASGKIDVDGGWRAMHDIDLDNCYVRIARAFARDIGMASPMIDDYCDNKETWRSNVPGVKQPVLASIFDPDASEEMSDSMVKRLKTTFLWKQKVSTLAGELKSLGKALAVEKDVISAVSSGSSKRGSVLARLYSRVERALVDQMIAVLKRYGFVIVSIVADGVIVRAEDWARKKAGNEVSCSAWLTNLLDATVNASWVYGDGVVAHRAFVKPWEVPKDLDEPASDRFNYKHETFGRVDASVILAKCGIHACRFSSRGDLLCNLILPLAWSARMSDDQLLLKTSGSYSVFTGEEKIETGDKKFEEAVFAKHSTFKHMALAKAGKFDYGNSMDLVDLSRILKPLNIFGAIDDGFTTMMLPSHPEWSPGTFTTKMDPLGIRQVAYETMTMETARSLSEKFFFHLREVITANVEGVYDLVVEVLQYILKGVRSEILLIFFGEMGGEGKSLFFLFFGVMVLGMDSFLAKSGLSWVNDRFQSYLMGKSMYLLEEIGGGKDKSGATMETLKDIVTRPRIPVETKNMDGVRSEVNTGNIIALVNSTAQQTPIKLTAGMDRRVVGITVKNTYVNDRAYMNELVDSFRHPLAGVAVAKMLTVGFPGIVKKSSNLARMESEKVFTPLTIPKSVLKNVDRIASVFDALDLVDKAVYVAMAMKRKNDRTLTSFMLTMPLLLRACIDVLEVKPEHMITIRRVAGWVRRNKIKSRRITHNGERLMVYDVDISSAESAYLTYNSDYMGIADDLCEFYD